MERTAGPPGGAAARHHHTRDCPRRPGTRSRFFFQAEDGIRDLTVTGVQTCALPIYCASKGALAVATEALRLELRGSGVCVTEIALGPVDTASSYENRILPGVDRWLDRTKPGSADAAAQRIVSAIERGRERVVHPRRLGIAHALPSLGRRFSARLSDRVQEDDPTVRPGGSQGDEAVRAGRPGWQPRARDAPGRRSAGGSPRA